MKIGIKLDVEKVVFDQNGYVNLMASLIAPDVSDAKKRNPLCVCAVVDRSGSMSQSGGALVGTKMDYVKKSVWKMIEHMTDEDSLALVFFDDRVDQVDFRKMTSANKEIMRQAVANVAPRGSTDMGSALLAAARLFDGYEGGVKSVERVMLLTDGEANVGAKHPEQFAPILSQVRGNVSLTCFGYGSQFNEELLASLSKTGKGNNYYIESPDNVAKVFAVELGGLLTCYAQDIVISIKAHKGAVVANVLNDLDVETAQDSDGELVTKVKVGDIYAGERRDVIVRLEFEKRPQALPRPVTLADITTTFRSMADAQTVTETAKTKVELVKTKGEATETRDPEIAEQVAIFEAANVMVEAKRLADQGQWQEAKTVITSSVNTLRGMNSPKAEQFAEGMAMFERGIDSGYDAGGNLSKSIGTYAYAASTSRAMRSVGNVADGLSAPMAMNCVMSSMVEDFTSGGNVTVSTPAVNGSGAVSSSSILGTSKPAITWTGGVAPQDDASGKFDLRGTAGYKKKSASR